MPTATSTLTVPSTLPTSIPLKGVLPSLPAPPSNSTTLNTLQSLYNRAARAFLHRDVPLTHSLLGSAFSILKPPASSASDALATHRRKWDILRITLETTLYASPPQSADLESLPAALRANLVVSSQYLVTSLHTRSLELFTPASSPRTANAAFLPPQVLVTLVLSSLKLDCVDVGRGMVEEWLARRGELEEASLSGDGEGYEKVLETYCLHVLPRLQQWDYAADFIQYEGELPQERRDHLRASLQNLRSEALAIRRPPPTSPRAASPAPSASSSSSSLSTHTAVPRTPRPMNSVTQYTQSNGLGVGLISPAASASSASLASTSTITHYSATPNPAAHSAQNSTRASRLAALAHDPSPTPVPRGPFASIDHSRATARSPSILALIRASLGPYLTTSRLATVIVLFIVLPVVSFLLRVRRRQRRLANGGAAASTAVQVRRRLKAAADGGGPGIVGKIIGEVLRVVLDAVKMGGSGLV